MEGDSEYLEAEDEDAMNDVFGWDSEPTIFENEDVLREDWVPNGLPEREEELREMASAFQPVRNGSGARNLFLYGKTGQGKSAATRYILNELKKNVEQADIDTEVSTFEISCQDQVTSYQLVGDILTAIDPDTDSRPSGFSLGDLNQRMFERFDEIGGQVVLVLDEIDNLSDDNILYQIPRARSNGRIENCHVSIIGISNDFRYRERLSPQVKDTLYDLEIDFEPYDATQLRPILRRRAELAFIDGALVDGVIPKCAALAAKDKGSARQAISFLRQAGEIARMRDLDQVTEEHVEEARDKLEKEYIADGVSGLTLHDHATLLAIASLDLQGETPARTRDVYEEYTRVTREACIDELSRRSIRERATSLDTYNIVIAHMNTGFGGEYHTIELDVDPMDLLQAIDEHQLSEIADKMIERHQNGLRPLPIE